jgi:hypothetical protein
MIMALLVPACGGADEPAAESSAESQPEASASKSFEVPLTANASEEDVFKQIVAAGHEQLTATCEANPGASIRVTSPIASGSYEDIACSTVLEGGYPAGQSSEAPTSGSEDVGQTQQKLGPISLVACGIFAAGSFLLMNEVLCPRGRTQQDRDNCGHVSNFGSAGITLLCALPF